MLDLLYNYGFGINNIVVFLGFIVNDKNFNVLLIIDELLLFLLIIKCILFFLFLNNVLISLFWCVCI